MAWQAEGAGPVAPLNAWGWLFEMTPPPGETEAHAPSVDPAACERRYAQAVAARAPDDAAAAVVMALLAIWESGRGFDGFASWVQRADELTRESPHPSPLACGALAFHSFTARWMGACDAAALQDELPALRAAVDATSSDALRILAASSEAYLLLMRGEQHAACECVRDAAFFAPAPNDAWVPKLHLAAVTALVEAFGGQADAQASQLGALLVHKDVDRWPTHLRLTLQGHHLMCLAAAGRLGETASASQAMRRLVIPGNRAYHRSYLHYALGVAALLAHEPADALAHARAAIDIGELSGSAVARLMPALLKAQALADLGRDAEALACLGAHEAAWSAHGIRLFAAAARRERALVLARQGRATEAAAELAAASREIPTGEPLPMLHRRHGDTPHTGAYWAGAWTPVREPPIQIRTLGAFGVQLNGLPCEGAAWRGARARTLLGTLVALGAVGVSADRLTDLLWPDTDGDKARANLKVAVWRLRKAFPGGSADAPWISLNRGEVSLDAAQCRVDAIAFESAAGQPLLDWDACARTLRWWSGEFMSASGDANPAIVAHRLRLARVHDRVSRLAAQHARLHPDRGAEETLAWLQTAFARQPIDLRNVKALVTHLVAMRDFAAVRTVVAHARDRHAIEHGTAMTETDLMQLQRAASGEA